MRIDVAQFDVYRNPSASARHGMPYVVTVQSDLLDGLQTRLTIPLGTDKTLSGSAPRNLCPAFEFDGETLYALPHFSVAFRTRDLGRPVGSLASQASDIVAALDAVISGV